MSGDPIRNTFPCELAPGVQVTVSFDYEFVGPNVIKPPPRPPRLEVLLPWLGEDGRTVHGMVRVVLEGPFQVPHER